MATAEVNKTAKLLIFTLEHYNYLFLTLKVELVDKLTASLRRAW